jgi:hypothetical protein
MHSGTLIIQWAFMFFSKMKLKLSTSSLVLKKIDQYQAWYTGCHLLTRIGSTILLIKLIGKELINIVKIIGEQ